MIPWLLLKGVPVFASFLQLPEWRNLAYAGLAVAVVVAFLARLPALVPRRLHGFGVVAALFLVVLMLHPPRTLSSELATEVLVNTRSLFLIISLLLLLWADTPPRVFLYLFALYMFVAQVVSLFSSYGVITTVTLDETKQRITGIYGGAVTIAYAAMGMVGVALIIREVARSRAVRLLALVAAALGVANILLSVNRAAIGALALLAGGWLVERSRGLHARSGSGAVRVGTAAAVALLVLAAAGLVVVRAAPQLVQNYTAVWSVRFGALWEPNSQGSRWLTVQAGWRMFLDHPISGVGWDQAPYHSVEYGATMESSVHNVFVQGAAEGGLIGAAYVVGLFLVIPWVLLRKSGGVPGRFVFAGAWAGIVLFNMLDSSLHLEAHWDLLMAWLMTCGSRWVSEQRRGIEQTPAPVS